ncbi:MAG: SUMF1/EgtB/PvdO family nonheme iron enzyme [Bradymonadaceae bacterium]|nr:SUMF1/EgtB/PvdO family nonheme iron enzyme [Lujinxingiaceae bacterium]
MSALVHFGFLMIKALQLCLYILMLALTPVVGSCDRPEGLERVTTTISGRVYDSTTGLGLARVVVTTEPASSQVATNGEGLYRIETDVQAGRIYRVLVTRSGYLPNSTTIDVAEGRNTAADIALYLQGPQLQVDTTTLEFGGRRERQQLFLSNVGRGKLDYRVAPIAGDWLELESATEGSVTDTSQTLTFRARRTDLDIGEYRTDVRITSNGGDVAINIRMEVLGPDAPRLAISPRSLTFGADSPPQYLSIENIGTGVLTWQIIPSEGWIGLTPQAGETTGGRDEVEVKVNRTTLPVGTHSGTIEIKTNHVDASIPVTVTIRGSGACLEGEVECNERCVSTRRDMRHCGGCGINCVEGAQCNDGTCECPGSEVVCDGRCVDTRRNTNHCGACRVSCVDGTCDTGTCVCPDRDLFCSGRCPNTFIDVRNCGGCHVSCATGASCTSGLCVCPSNGIVCDGVCRAIATDPSNCGDCGIACATGATCYAGRCQCPNEGQVCGGECKDTLNDIINCGDCDVQCAQGAACDNGTCLCPAGAMVCQGSCVATVSDSVNCGGCGIVCLQGKECKGGTCTCPGDGLVCDGVCRNTQDDPIHCGSCGNVCATGAQCAIGLCSCPTGEQVCDGQCTNILVDAANCGDCGNKCGLRQLCEAGQCTPYSELYTVVPPGTYTQAPYGWTRKITLTRPFAVQLTEVTQGQWRNLMGSSPSYFFACGDDCPVERVNWWEALEYLNAMSQRDGLEQCYTLTGCTGTIGAGCPSTGTSATSCSGGTYICSSVTFVGLDCRGYRLMTDAEWEYAALGAVLGWHRGNCTVTYSPSYDQSPIGPSSCGTHPFGGHQPNSRGLYDMLGNVSQWVWDWKPDGYTNYSLLDPLGPDTGYIKITRGCSWLNNSSDCEVSDIGVQYPYNRYFSTGFRAAQTVP